LHLDVGVFLCTFHVYCDHIFFKMQLWAHSL
jgi:hypothetical protein